MHRRYVASFLLGFLILPSLMFGVIPVFAESEIEQLQNQIANSNDRLKIIEAEIAQFESALQEVGAEKETLQKAISRLELERKKVQADIEYTENKISSTDLELNKLILEISKTEREITQHKEAISEIIRTIYQNDELTMVELLLSYEHLSDFWSDLANQEIIRDSMSEKVARLDMLRETLAEKRDATTKRRNELVDLKEQYSDQSSILVNNKAEQTELLVATKNEEANYQDLLNAKRAARDQIIKEMREYEAKLQFILDPNKIPSPGTQVFDWPLDNIIITQYFGGTEFAKQNSSVYAGRAYHPGIDLGVPRGSKIYAPLTGVVRATGNTDAVPGCYSWGKWTLIDHANGLSTLYAHQDLISVSPGQTVKTGDVIGYSGNTGYSTGPHLHFSVYASDGVQVRYFNEIKTVTSCGAATTPVAATEAYLDPLNYLPPV